MFLPHKHAARAWPATLSLMSQSGAAPATAVSPPPLRLAPEVEEAHAKLVKALHGSILQAHLNAPPKQALCVEALLRLVQNCLAHPEEEKYRRVRATNESFRARVLAVKGGEDFLKAAVRCEKGACTLATPWLTSKHVCRAGGTRP